MRYDPGRDLGWLLLRPWVAIPRLVQVLWSLAGLVLVLLLRGGSSDPAVQQGLARRILNTLTGLGPCFIKLGQALVGQNAAQLLKEADLHAKKRAER